MMIMKRLLFLVSVCSLCMVGNSQNYQPEKHAVVKSDRGDGRLLSTYAIVHEMLKDTHPQYAYRSGMSAQEFTQWQDGVRAAMVEIMKFPEIKRQPSPVCVKTEKKEGYILEKWEFYPFPKSVSTFLVLKPEHLKGAVPVLNWMKAQSYIRKDRIVISGFSLGTEPMMVLGVLDKDIYAFVYNDFLCQTQERAVVMTKPDKENRRPFPNSIRHLIPGYWRYFNFPDVVASLAPRPIIFTEGGLDRDFRLVQSAYAASGKPENAEFHHYPKFADKAVRKDVEHLDEGLDSKTYFEAVNVDPPSHYFKNELVIPWLRKVLK